MNNGTDANLPDQSLEHLTDASKLLIDPSAFKFLLESIYGDNPLNSKVAATLRTSFARECAKARLEELESVVDEWRAEFSEANMPLVVKGHIEQLKEEQK